MHLFCGSLVRTVKRSALPLPGKCSSVTVSVQLISLDDYCQRKVIKDKNESARPCLCFKPHKSLVIRSSTGRKQFAVILHQQNSFSGFHIWDWHCISVLKKIFKNFCHYIWTKGLATVTVQIAFIDCLKNRWGQILPLLTNVQSRGMPLRLSKKSSVYGGMGILIMMYDNV